MSDIVERLRAEATNYSRQDVGEVCDEAAAHIEAQAAEIARLRAEVERYAEREAYFARLLAVPDGGQYRHDWDGAVMRLVAERDAARALLDWLERNPQCEVSHDGWDDPPKWRVHEVTGGRNDREWRLVGEGDTVREAIEAARAALRPPPDLAEQLSKESRE